MFWQDYGLKYRPDHFRFGMAGFVVTVAAIGITIGRGARMLTRLAAAMVILSAVASVVGLYLGAECGAIDPARSSMAFLALVFAIHSLWGWVLLPVSSRLG